MMSFIQLEHTINHQIWKRDFTGSSGLFSFILKKNTQTILEKFYKN